MKKIIDEIQEFKALSINLRLKIEKELTEFITEKGFSASEVDLDHELYDRKMNWVYKEGDYILLESDKGYECRVIDLSLSDIKKLVNHVTK